MIFEIVKGDLFTANNEYYLAHCISADYAMGAGIAKPMNKKYNLRKALYRIGDNKFPDCILVGRVFNLVTKKVYYNKPTYASLTHSLKLMKEIIKNENIKKIAMPKIGSGLDRLQWAKVEETIKTIFKGMDIEIKVYALS